MIRLLKIDALCASIGLFALTCLLVQAPGLKGQALFGTLVGNVTDNTQGAIPGASVRIVNTGTGREWDLSTNEVGQSVPPSRRAHGSATSEGFRRSRGAASRWAPTPPCAWIEPAGQVAETVEVPPTPKRCRLTAP